MMGGRTLLDKLTAPNPNERTRWLVSTARAIVCNYDGANIGKNAVARAIAANAKWGSLPSGVSYSRHSLGRLIEDLWDVVKLLEQGVMD